MDPISHVIFGRAVVAVIDGAPVRKAVSAVSVAAVLGGLAPDVDFVLMPAGWDIYLRFHQTGTHSIIGAGLVGCGAGLLAAIFARWRMPASRPSAIALAALGGAAALSHLVLDVLSGAELALGWPLVESRFGLPLVAMADPWLVLLLAAGAIFMWRARAALAKTALWVLVAAAGLLGVKAILYAHALRTIAAASELKPQSARLLEARWGAWTEWNVFARDEDALRAWRVTAGNAALVPLLVWPGARSTSFIDASRSLNTVDNFLTVHDLGFAIEDRLESGDVEVLWSDIRYCWQGALSSPPRCALWFGGLFDATGRALKQVVHVGAWTQVRPPPS